eukprot:c8538_g1_i1.p1 GENE.c8538_g1_i1~~c8538_g1_i1.p1  ORF type:complete len:461 (-),score=85.66 c8538_g1_i1:35-1243(-)
MPYGVWASLHSLSHIYLARIADLGAADIFPLDRWEQTTWAGLFGRYVTALFLVQVLFFTIEWCYRKLCDWGVFKHPYEFPKTPIKPGHLDRTAALYYDTPMSLYEKFKIFLFVVSGMLFFRVICATLAFFAACVMISLCSWYEHPWWRALFHALTRVFYRCMMFFYGFYVVRGFGTPAPPRDVKLLIGNHTGPIEIVILFNTCFPSFVTRVENLTIPLFSGIVKAVDAIVVNRDDAESKKITMDIIQRRANDPSSAQLMIFPEGTTNNQHALFQFRKGAFVSGQPVQPVVFHYPYRHLNPCFTGRIVGGLDLVDLIIRLASQFVNRAEFKFLPVYHPSEEEKKNPELYAENVRVLMASHLGIKVSDASYQDYKDALEKYHQAHNEERSRKRSQTNDDTRKQK